MTPNVFPGNPDASHDISLSDGTTTYGFIFDRGGPRILQEIPLSPPAQEFENKQQTWVNGRGRLRYHDDPGGFFDSHFIWNTTEGKLFPTLQWRFADIGRSCDSSLPDDNATVVWWKLYGNTPASKIARYAAIAFAASASYNADKGYLWVRRRGTPTGNLTLELCADGTGKPGTVLKTVTKTVSDITDTVSVFKLFDWTTTQALVATTTYYLNIYGASGDTADNHWELLCASAGDGLYSADGSTYAAASVAPYYRITDADTARKWYPFILVNHMYAVSQNDDGTASALKMNGQRGKATSATATTLADSAKSMVTNRYAGAYIRIYNGTGDGQVRQITSHNATTFTVPTWDITPDTTSQYYVYANKFFIDAPGTPGLGSVVNQPCVAGKIAYFPQGQAAIIRRMRVNAASHDYAADTGNKADNLYLSVQPNSGAKIFRSNDVSTDSKVSSSALKDWGTDLSFGTATTIGSGDFKITNLQDYNSLHIFKEDGPYKFESGKVRKVGVSFGDIIDPDNGKAVTTDNNGYLWFSWGHSIVKMLGASASDMLNYRQGYEGFPANRRGTPVKAASVAGWLFFAMDGGADKYSSVIVWNGMGWGEIFRGWDVGVRIRNIFWQPCPGTRGRLWVDVNGELVFIEFPAFASNPLKDTTINYQHEGVLTSTTYDAGDPNLYKIFHLLRLMLDQGTIEVDYQTDQNVGTDTWTVLGTASTVPLTDLTLDLGAKFQLRFRFRLQNSNSRTPTTMIGTEVSGRMMGLKKYQFIGRFHLESNGEDKTGNPDDNPNTVYSQLQTWATQQTKLTLRSLDPSKDSKIVTVTLPAKVVDWLDPDEAAWGGSISFAALEV